MSTEVYPLQIRLPIDPRFAQTLRLAVSSIATIADFTLDQIEDLKIAVEEAFLMSAERPDGSGELGFTFMLHDDRIEMRVGELPAPIEEGESDEERSYGLMILRAVVDEANFVETPDGAELIMVKFKQREA